MGLLSMTSVDVLSSKIPRCGLGESVMITVVGQNIPDQTVINTYNLHTSRHSHLLTSHQILQSDVIPSSRLARKSITTPYLEVWPPVASKLAACRTATIISHAV